MGPPGIKKKSTKYYHSPARSSAPYALTSESYHLDAREGEGKETIIIVLQFLSGKIGLTWTVCLRIAPAKFVVSLYTSKNIVRLQTEGENRNHALRHAYFCEANILPFFPDF
jgi:hypothetical protein